MLKSVAVIVYVIIKVVGIGKKIIVPAKHVRRIDRTPGEKRITGIPDLENLTGFIFQRPPRFIPQVGVGVPVAQDFDRIINPDGTVIGGDHHIDILFRQEFHDLQQRGVLKPAHGEGTIGLFIVGQLPDDLHFSAGMREHIDKVVNDEVEAVHHEVGHQFNQLLPVSLVQYLIIGVLHIAAVTFQVFAQQFVFVIVFRAFFVLVDPQFRVFLFDFGRQEAGKQSVAGILRHGRNNAVVDLLLFNTEVVLEDRLKHFPLIEAEIVDQNHEQRPVIVHERKNLLFNHGM